jgi:hypothetical protein
MVIEVLAVWAQQFPIFLEAVLHRGTSLQPTTIKPSSAGSDAATVRGANRFTFYPPPKQMTLPSIPERYSRPFAAAIPS